MLRQNLMARNKTVSATKVILGILVPYLLPAAFTVYQCFLQLGLNSVAATENASRGAGPMLSANWRPSRDSVSIVTTVVGVRMAPPALLIDLGHRQGWYSSAHARTQGLTLLLTACCCLPLPGCLIACPCTRQLGSLLCKCDRSKTCTRIGLVARW